jgi:Fe-S-cluster containining protein
MGSNLQTLKDYKLFIADVDRRCHQIVDRHRDQIACTSGCAGNCCRIHLSVYPVEAVSLSLALQKLAPEIQHRIQARARHTNSFGPCPLLEDGACLMYDARAVICRTHGLPTSTEYKGRRAVGFCVKNFKQLDPIPDEDIIDLAHLNRSLAGINIRFVHENPNLLPPSKRFTLAEALLMSEPSTSVSFRRIPRTKIPE